jgi:hypothetical protein
MLTVTYVSGHLCYRCDRVGPKKLILSAGEGRVREKNDKQQKISSIRQTLKK